MVIDTLAPAPADTRLVQPHLEPSPTPATFPLNGLPETQVNGETKTLSDAPLATPLDEAEARVEKAKIQLAQATEAKQTAEIATQPNADLIAQAEVLKERGQRLHETLEARVHPSKSGYTHLQRQLGAENVRPELSRENEDRVADLLHSNYAKTHWNDTPRNRVVVLEALKGGVLIEAEEAQEKAEEEWEHANDRYARLQSKTREMGDHPELARRQYYAVMRHLAEVAQVPVEDAVALANLRLQGVSEFVPFEQAREQYPQLQNHPSINRENSDYYGRARSADEKLRARAAAVDSEDQDAVRNRRNILNHGIRINHTNDRYRDAQALMRESKQSARMNLTIDEARRIVEEDAFLNTQAQADIALDLAKAAQSGPEGFTQLVTDTDRTIADISERIEDLRDEVERLRNPDEGQTPLSRAELEELWAEADVAFFQAETLRLRAVKESPQTVHVATPVQDHAVTAARRELVLAQQEAERKRRAHEEKKQPQQEPSADPSESSSPADNATLQAAETRAQLAEEKVAAITIERDAARSEINDIVATMVDQAGDPIPDDASEADQIALVTSGLQVTLDLYRQAQGDKRPKDMVAIMEQAGWMDGAVAKLPETVAANLRVPGILVRGAAAATAERYVQPENTTLRPALMNVLQAYINYTARRN